MHLQVRDLDAAIDWFETILQVHPGFRNDRMATFSFNSLILVFDAANDDAQATVGFESDDCDRDFRAVVKRGAVAIQEPTNQAWGVRTGYFKGPGALKFEIEGPVPK
jgi:catechol 2,3-dioxygenase-like lactoylglutathione lyase family enzyme